MATTTRLSDSRTPLSHQKYRPDIDGLRAVAVLSVVAYHAAPGHLPSGFIGVDIFFVISGFLISSIVFSNLESNSFSIFEFYRRRIRRIFPALTTVLVASFAYSWFVLLSDEGRQLGKHIAAGAGFISNFVLWSESGYFNVAANTKPLLHLWSLAIEEQFYFFWPLLLALFWKRSWNFMAITLLIAIASFAANVYTVERDPTAAFYSPVVRFWELMIGGVLAYITLHHPQILTRHPDAQSALGFAVLGVGLFFLNESRAFPGWWALLPTLGAFFIISAGPGARLNQAILSSRPLVWIGLISYPLYLWHWPLLAFARIVEVEPLTPAFRIGLVVASVLLAWATYKLIETPLRTSHRDQWISAMLFGLMVLIGTAGFIVYKQDAAAFASTDGLSKTEYYRHFENDGPAWQYAQRMRLAEKFREECNFYDIEKFRVGQATRIPRPTLDASCFRRNPSTSKVVLIWGDSHAQQLNSGLASNLPSEWQVLQVASSGCVAKTNAAGPSDVDFCTHSNWFAMTTIKEAKPDVVVVAQKTGHDVMRFANVAVELKALGVKKVIYVGPTPRWTAHLPKIVVRKLWPDIPQRTWRYVDRDVIQEDKQLAQFAAKHDSFVYASAVDVFCGDQGCLTYVGDDNMNGITTWDYGHLTPTASSYLSRNLLVDLVTGGN